MARPVVRGKPEIDAMAVTASSALVMEAGSFKKNFKLWKRNLSEESLYYIQEQIFLLESEITYIKAGIEQMKRVRLAQSTALVGGGRRKHFPRILGVKYDETAGIKDTGKTLPRINVTGSTQRRIDPDAVAEALGANPQSKRRRP